MTKNDTMHSAWNKFSLRQKLTAEQLAQFVTYYKMLVETNHMHNLTAITTLEDVITDHFEDSLALRKFFDCASITALCDVGTGAGFPAIPLKIVFPHLELVLIEVTQKKREFLESVAQELKLENVTISELDWRTFLRKTNFSIQLFCARASLQAEELVRIYKPSTAYTKARLVYWASQHWRPDEKIKPFIEKTEQYVVGDKNRSLVFFKNTSPQ